MPRLWLSATSRRRTGTIVGTIHLNLTEGLKPPSATFSPLPFSSRPTHPTCAMDSTGALGVSEWAETVVQAVIHCICGARINSGAMCVIMLPDAVLAFWRV
ncbi:hypothetical protein FB45DRAFT_919614 [Roridomyces roridus]|uniref:Uncharacterized protein n=1 Tax=Roridomyces roridus TaxID=1738132 RepID=A0AAD7FMQ7_9AGAR|nr:hypothetical protein FB45DRAFT_919614 [Roridomyces roridus]